jgi:hypothetical protein
MSTHDIWFGHPYPLESPICRRCDRPITLDMFLSHDRCFAIYCDLCRAWTTTHTTATHQDAA